jgi:hypothetical protein
MLKKLDEAFLDGLQSEAKEAKAKSAILITHTGPQTTAAGGISMPRRNVLLRP